MISFGGPLVLPLAVFRTTAYCGRDHEVTVISDGQHVYAAGPLTACGLVTRYQTTLSVTCSQPGAHDEPCDSIVEVTLDTPGTWTIDPEARRLLADHGEPVSQ